MAATALGCWLVAFSMLMGARRSLVHLDNWIASSMAVASEAMVWLLVASIHQGLSLPTS